MNLYRKFLKRKKYTLSSGRVVYENPSPAIFVIVSLLIFTFISVKITGFSLKTLMKNSHQLFAILSPKISFRIEIGQTEEGKGIISIYSHEGYQVANDSDYDSEREAQKLLRELKN